MKYLKDVTKNIGIFHSLLKQIMLLYITVYYIIAFRIAMGKNYILSLLCLIFLIFVTSVTEYNTNLECYLSIIHVHYKNNIYLKFTHQALLRDKKTSLTSYIYSKGIGIFGIMFTVFSVLFSNSKALPISIVMIILGVLLILLLILSILKIKLIYRTIIDKQKSRNKFPCNISIKTLKPSWTIFNYNKRKIHHISTQLQYIKCKKIKKMQKKFFKNGINFHLITDNMF